MFRPRIAASAVLMAFLAGCSTTTTYDRETGSQFVPYPDGTFRMRTSINMGRPDTETGERSRITFLEDWLRGERLCPAGYEITSRTVTPKGLASDVIYVGRCKR